MNLVRVLAVAVEAHEQLERRGGIRVVDQHAAVRRYRDVDFAHVWMNPATVSKISVSTAACFLACHLHADLERVVAVLDLEQAWRVD